MKRRYDARASAPRFNSGQLVWLTNTARGKGRSRKLRNRYMGPYTIVRQVNDVNYVIQLTSRSKKKLMHADRMWEYLSTRNCPVKDYERNPTTQTSTGSRQKGTVPIDTSTKAPSLNVTVDTGALHPDQHATSNRELVRARQRHKRVSGALHTTRQQATQRPAPNLAETDIESSATALLTTFDIHTVPSAHVDTLVGRSTSDKASSDSKQSSNAALSSPCDHSSVDGNDAVSIASTSVVEQTKDLPGYKNHSEVPAEVHVQPINLPPYQSVASPQISGHYPIHIADKQCYCNVVLPERMTAEAEHSVSRLRINIYFVLLCWFIRYVLVYFYVA